MKLMLAPSLGFLAASLSSLVACGSAQDGLDGSGGAPDDEQAATGGQLASSGGAPHGAGGSVQGTGGSAAQPSSRCGYPEDAFLKMNDATYRNEPSDSVGQGCDPIVTGDYIDSSDKSEVWVFSGWEEEGSSGDGTWGQQLVLVFPGKTTGEYTDLSATPASALLTVNGAHCTGFFLTLSVTEYGEVGGKIAGSFSADLLDAMQTGQCPAGISGEFSVTRKR